MKMLKSICIVLFFFGGLLQLGGVGNQEYYPEFRSQGIVQILIGLLITLVSGVVIALIENKEDEE